MSEPKTFTSYEFGFANGQVVAFTIEHGRDALEWMHGLHGKDGVVATVHHDDAVEIIELVRPWCYSRAIERTEKPEAPSEPE